MSWWWVAIAAAVCLVAAAALAWRSARRGVDPTRLSLTPDQVARWQQLTASGQKTRAIKELREQTGVSLPHAKAMAERLRARSGSAPEGQAPHSISSMRYFGM